MILSPSRLFQVNYRPKVLVKGAPSSLYSQLTDTKEIQFAREMTELHSQVPPTAATVPDSEIVLVPVTDSRSVPVPVQLSSL